MARLHIELPHELQERVKGLLAMQRRRVVAEYGAEQAERERER